MELFKQILNECIKDMELHFDVKIIQTSDTFNILYVQKRNKVFEFHVNIEEMKNKNLPLRVLLLHLCKNFNLTKRNSNQNN